MMGRLRTIVLFLAFMFLMALVGWVSAGFWGTSPTVSIAVFVLLAGALNLVFYFYSDRIVLASYHAKIVTAQEAPRLHRIVDRVVLRAEIPKPRIAVIPSPAPNAFATGRSPKHAVVAATEGIMGLLSDEELEGVLAHEISHVRNRDTLVMTIAATFASAISFASRMVIFGRNRDMNPLVAILVFLTAPLAAILLQLAVSRSREYKADSTGARILGNPEPLASALEKLEQGARVRPLQMGNPTTGSLFIVNPFRGAHFGRLFSTHPRTEDRCRRLRGMRF